MGAYLPTPFGNAMVSTINERHKSSQEKKMAKMNWDKVRRERYVRSNMTETEEAQYRKLMRYMKEVRKVQRKPEKAVWTEEKNDSLLEKIARYKEKRKSGLI
jgi:hypothetical protein